MNTDTAFTTYIEHELNAAQKEAVLHKEGPLLIVAGAGSGKTRVITARITHLLLNHSVAHSAILALTFTNKAALEMKERIETFLERKRELPFVGTFHAFCLRLLKQQSDLLEKPFISILDEDDQHKLLHGIITKSGLQKKITAKQLSYQISHIKNQTIEPHAHDFFSINPMIRDIYHAYEHEKRASKCLDFDDLLLETVRLFKNNPSFKQMFQQRVRHILVDEYQDTNIVQHELLKHLTLHDAGRLTVDSLCAVGDEDQSIYSWRGATVSNIMNFSRDFTGTKIIKIEQNYRSVQPILDLANTIIACNSNRNPKNLWSEKKGSDRIRLCAFLSEYQEAEAIALYLKAVINAKTKLRDNAILYRTHFQSRALEEALLKYAIPYKIVGGVQFYERKEIKDILAYLKLIINPFDRASLFRVLNVPLRGLGAKFEELFHQTWETHLLFSFHEVAQHLIESAQVTGTKKDALVAFLALFSSLRPSDTASRAVSTILHVTGYFSYLKESYDPEEATTRIENIKELQKAIAHFESQKTLQLTDFLDEVALMQAQIQEESNEKDPVLLMTLHAAKGLEFDTVILTGLEEGLLPSSRSLAQEESVEEERRLFYVGITRARERLLLTYSRYRYNYGTMTDQRPSRFIQDIPSGTVPSFDGSYWKTMQTEQFFTSWLSSKKLSSSPDNSLKSTYIQKKEPTTKSLLFSTWKKNQPVSHQSFGVGIIQDIELRADGKTYLQIKFKIGSKKLDSQFVKSL